jgi:hypothetical protein
VTLLWIALSPAAVSSFAQPRKVLSILFRVIARAIQSNVTWSIANYTDATARQYLIDTYHWTINAGNFDGIKTIKGNNNANTLNTTHHQQQL